ncbi:MAG: adenylosuccinate synthase [Pseudobdellovibrionaceae bacterium]
MSGVVVVGAQWGDEGKGKLVDVFAGHTNFVVRYQGGANAGHTLVVNGTKFVLHTIPSGILHPDVVCVIAAAVVIDIEALVKEIDGLQVSGFLKESKQLLISDLATVILPIHRKLDQVRELSLGNDKIGTTGKGIGPAYEDRAARRGITIGDLFKPDSLRKKLEMCFIEKNALLKDHYKTETLDVDQTYSDLLKLAEKIAPYRCADVSLVLNRGLKTGKKVVFEGAQGTMLDIYHGTYPFVTSSSTVAGSSCSGAGVGPTSIQKVIGVFKAYTTRVGSGPFPTELQDEVGLKIQTDGHEFGSTTGRARRCGWLDLVALKYAIRVNGITNLALMKLDILSGHEKIAVCHGYKINGEIVTEWPTHIEDLKMAEPVYEYLSGWKEDISKVLNLKDLPRSTTSYIDYVGKQLGTPIDIISVGPGREQTLWVKPLFQ